MKSFIIAPNNFLRKRIVGYYHQDYTGYKKPGNPDFLNTLKNTYNTEQERKLIDARKI